MREVLIVRDGTAGITYMGHCGRSYDEIKSDMLAGLVKAIELTEVYIIQTLTMPIGPGQIAQEVNVFPLDTELDCVKSITVLPTSVYAVSEDGYTRLMALVKKCETNLVRMRSGLSLASTTPPDQGGRGGGIIRG